MLPYAVHQSPLQFRYLHPQRLLTMSNYDYKNDQLGLTNPLIYRLRATMLSGSRNQLYIIIDTKFDNIFSKGFNPFCYIESTLRQYYYQMFFTMTTKPKVFLKVFIFLQFWLRFNAGNFTHSPFYRVLWPANVKLKSHKSSKHPSSLHFPKTITSTWGMRRSASLLKFWGFQPFFILVRLCNVKCLEFCLVRSKKVTRRLLSNFDWLHLRWANVKTLRSSLHMLSVLEISLFHFH